MNAMQSHTEPLCSHKAISSTWKQLLFHRGDNLETRNEDAETCHDKHAPSNTDRAFGEHEKDTQKGHEVHGGTILQEYMNPKEMDVFNNTGHPPTERRPCLLCMRTQTHYAYMCMLQSTHKFSNASIIINSFVNPRNASDGYSSEFMIPRESTPVFQGLAGSVCVAEKHLLSWRVNSDGIKMIDQSKLKWTAPESIRLNTQGPYFR
ncbi:hypothetical protein CYMTET_8406 [Cymbomonas tetramitiformis]|uniref:Uncharacterized protein n=1 Tax=Cymbomonas tetramitiformis TaxID=36881 RepID=A0AAE0BF92_9CHLO|nr:hypothetical protein CYMTET_55110 [Cymbomonas tetramitiformis]KAK3283918.1 hypothetical protein CYMTET_8406 [Cymbomonas tetramitiformis]